MRPDFRLSSLLPPALLSPISPALNHSAGHRAAVFLDRDGTLMEEVDYCGDPAKVRVLPGVPTALKALKTLGFRLVIVTNQSGIGRGYFSEQDFQNVQEKLLSQMGAPGVIDATYHCPDAPDHAGDRRKPASGMILEAVRDLDLDPARSFIVGDTCADVLCGHHSGLAGSILVLTGHGPEEAGKCQPDHIAKDFAAAAAWIAEQSSRHG